MWLLACRRVVVLLVVLRTGIVCHRLARSRELARRRRQQQMESLAALTGEVRSHALAVTYWRCHVAITSEPRGVRSHRLRSCSRRCRAYRHFAGETEISQSAPFSSSQVIGFQLLWCRWHHPCFLRRLWLTLGCHLEQSVAVLDVDFLSVSATALTSSSYSMSSAMHAEAVRNLDSEQRACDSLRRSKVDCVAMLRCAKAVLYGTNDPVLAELVAVSGMTAEQVRAHV